MILFVASLLLNNVYAESTRTVFIVQDDKANKVLKADANLIAARIKAAKAGDSIQAFTTSGDAILNYEFRKKASVIRLARDKAEARKRLQRFFSKFLRERPNRSNSGDVAKALAKAMDRFNYSRGFDQMVLVLLSDGLQRDKIVDWRGYVPSDSWVVHVDSPFSRVDENVTGAPLEVVIIHRMDAYFDAYQANQIERWYRLFFHIKKARLILFTADHLAAAELLILRKSKNKPLSPPSPVDLNGPLVLTLVANITNTQPEEDVR